MADVGKSSRLSDAISNNTSSSDATELEKLQEERDKRRAARRKKEAFKEIDERYKREEDRAKARQNWEWREKERQLQAEHDLRMEYLQYQAKYGENWRKRLAASLHVDSEEFVKNIEKGVGHAVGTVLSAATQSVDSAIGLLNQYQTSISTRAQGTATFQDMYDMIKKNVAMSPYVKQTAVLENLSKLVESGIAFNVEQRAFLNTIKDEIATTFDAANGTLLQLVRIQQADTTAARLGMEAYLTRFLNANFQDTSYLSGGYDTTSASLLAMSASAKSATEAAELEFIAQKWLGSLAAVGVSDSTLQMLAQGISALGSGNVSQLSSNSQMQALLAMASSRGGIGFGETLAQGLTADKLNTLLSSIVTYGQQIASTTNAVVRNQYAQLFGMSVSDLRAMQNLSADQLSNIYKTNLGYGNMIGELGYQYSQIGSRLPISQMVTNVLDNILTNTGMGIATNPAAYAAWVVNDLVEKATGGINIPTVGALGNFVGLNATVNQLAKVAMVGLPLMASVGTAIGSLFDGKDMLDLWGLRSGGVTTRGGRATEVSLGRSVTGLTSQSSFVGTTDSSAIYEASVTSARDKAKQEVQSEEGDTALQDAIVEGINPNIRSILQLLNDVVSGVYAFHVVGKDILPSTTPGIGGLQV